MSRSSPFVEFAAGDVIIREASPADALYIIETGKATITRASDPGRVLVELGPGDFFGETAILQEQPTSATVTASAPLRALKIEAAAFHAVLRENVEIAVQLMRRLVLRLQSAEQKLAQATPVAGDVMPAFKPKQAPAPAAAAAAAEIARSAPAAEAVPTALVLRHGSDEIRVPAGKQELLIGRPDPATGAVPEVNLGPFDQARTLSRRHARLLLANGRWHLREEPGVGNGSWVNGERLQPEQQVPVKAGDKLRFGAVEIDLLRD